MFKAAGGKDFVVFNGPDEQFVGGRAIGAAAGIGGTYGVMPELFLKLNDLVIGGKREEACELQHSINAIIYKMCSGHANMYAVAKEILRINEHLNIGSVREPLTGLCSTDLPIAQEAAGMIRSAVEAFIK